jgi:predicted enzyme related to lactoylglutathione lyase
MAHAPRVTGIGGIFFKSKDPVALAAWYRDQLGVPVEGSGTFGTFTENRSDDVGAAAQTVWATFPADTKYFDPTAAPFMINYRVADLAAMLAHLRSAGVKVDDRVEDTEYGRFGWATDPDGNRFELWQPQQKEI